MDDSSSGNSFPDMQRSILESKTNQNLSVGHFPSEAGPDCEGIIPCEDLTSEGPSSLPPVQGACGTSSVRGPMGRRNRIKDKPEDLGEKAIMEIMYAYLNCLHEDSVAKWAQSDDYQRMDKHQQETITQSFCELEDIKINIKEFLDNPEYDEEDDTVLPPSPQEENVGESVLPNSSQQEDVQPKNVEDDDTVHPDSPPEEDVAYSVPPESSQKEDVDNSVPTESPQEEEDVQPSRSVSSHMDQVSPEEQEACQDLPKCQRAENGDIKPFLEMPPGLEEDEIVELESQEPGTVKSSPVSALQSEEGDLPSDKEGTSCMNFRGLFHWLRKRLVSSLPGRKRREKAKKVSSCWR
ncbi:uncharacterized protein C12orf71 homolog [Marmota flaviventris]|uniref:uncharacterized protein C12orf71 homolog n=1 Tax=Marmota flaviventris TaxID=93162 RepID=UPI003A8B16BF